ncbi:class I SAM-dependent methyltransferase [Streptomyces sp. CA-181903]|uniref:class I SAM-dependent methyltransferase n=1 Tax=Streptomyces sp. CA-181903 TaxID=3240055 RepID=UPI003D8FEF01
MYTGASSDALEEHYDLPAAFFRQWLDPSLTYSCALWQGTDDLAAAQQKKLDYLIEQVGADGAGRVLDIGCGWGSALLRLADRGVRHATGLNPSRGQAAWAGKRLGSRAVVLAERWEDHEPETGYGAILSIGAFEHFARPGMSGEERIAAYRAFFTRCHRWLPPGGRLGLQTIVWADRASGSGRTVFTAVAGANSGLRDMVVFPESDLPVRGEIERAVEGLFEIVALRQDGDHYRRTCQVWEERLRARREEARFFVGEAVVTRYERYLSVASRLFAARWLDLLRITFSAVG